MFERLGRFATHHRIPIIMTWIALAAIITLVAPNIDEVASSDQADFVPQDAPFIHAMEVYQDAFPDSFAPSSTVIVIDARAGAGIRSEPVWAFIGALETWLRSDDAPDNIDDVMAPTTSEAAVALMVAPAGDVAVVRVNLATTGTDEQTAAAMDALDDWMAEHLPDGVHTYQTGEAPIVNDTTESIKTSVDRTIWVTIALVVIMLLLVYRSPVSPLIPLAAVTVAYLITRGIVAYLGAHFMTITSYANVLLIVIMYGAGTDYCLFLISRFREEMADNIGVERATARTVHLVGETITSSAGTVFVGFMAMSLAEMGIFNTSGPALAIGIVIGLLAGLTFTPALLATLGERAFWPRPATHRSTGRYYGMTSQLVSSRPLLTILIIVAIMAPLSIYGLDQRVTYNMLADLPDDKPAVVGYGVLEGGLGSGSAMPLTVVVTGRDPDRIASEIPRLDAALGALPGVGGVRSLHNPLGADSGEVQGLLRVDRQLRLALGMMESFQTPDAFDPQALSGMLDGVGAYLDLLAARFPVVADDPNLDAARELLDNPMQLVLRRDDFAAALDGLAARFETIEDAYLLPTAFAEILSALPASETGDGAALFGQLLPTYANADLTAYKLEVILSQPPVSYEAMDTLHEIRNLLKPYGDPGDAVVSGGTATIADIRDTMDRDLLRAIGFVLLGIFIVLLIMLRSVVAPLYLIGTVLLSFTCTLGLTSIVFETLAGVEEITWFVPFFMFVFLVALGVDYSIFLFGRIKEEVAYHGIREGVHIAVARTGAIITSAGVILAGTFGAMMSGEIMGLIQIGFAVSVGVLIDTFVVRTMLDPALAALFGRWTWWPGGVPKAPASPAEPQPVVHPGD
ncbi:MAG: MMPL family transporter [Chloroflexi bacterium]|nr:MMPL family transporter [Chloroflexota bacterium]